MVRTALLTAVIALTIVTPLRFALALCFEPRAPSAPFSSAPSAPYCGSHGNLSGCDRWEIDNFRAEVEDHISKMESYADEAARFAKKAIEYAQCEANQAIEEWNSFVGG